MTSHPQTPFWLASLLLLVTSIDESTRLSADDRRPKTVKVSVEEGPKLPLAVAGHVGGLVEGLPVVAGGSSWSDDRKTKSWRRESFVFRDSQWSPGPLLPHPLCLAAYAVEPRGLYLAGGNDGAGPTDHVLNLSSVSADASWRKLAALPEPMEGASAAILDGKFYVCCGFGRTAASNRLWMLDFDVADAKWRTLAPLPAPARALAAVVVDGPHLYLFGGVNLPPYQKALEVYGDAYRYSLATDRWERVGGFDLPGYAWTATAVGHEQILFAGRAPKVGVTSDELWLFDRRAGSVRSVGRLIIPACCMPSIPRGGSRWWFPGGEPDTTRNRTARTSVVTLERNPAP